MTTFHTNVSLLVHQLREVVEKQKEVHAKRNSNNLLASLENQIALISNRDTCEFSSGYNIGSIKTLFNMLLSVIKEQSERINKLEGMVQNNNINSKINKPTYEERY